MLLSRKSIFVTIAVFFVAGIVAIASPHLYSKTLPNTAWEQPMAQMSRQSRAHANREGRGRLLEKLNLSGEQKQEIASIRQKYQGQIEQLQETSQATQEELFSMMAGTATESAIRAKRQELVQSRQQLGDLRFESMMEMREVLTPEQRSQLAQMLQKRRDNWRNRFDNGDRSGKNWF